MWLGLCVGLGLTACASLRSTSTLPLRPLRQDIAAFTIEARLNVRQGEKSSSVRLSWQHQAERDEMLVTGPFGQGIAELVRDAAGARMTGADHKEIAARDWDTLTEKVFGITLPLNGIARWLPGNATRAEYDALGHPIHAEEQGWHIAWPAYESDATNALPTVVTLQRDDIEVRLKIDQWQLN